MKKFLPVFAIVLLSTLVFFAPSAQAQCTVDTTVSSPGFSPNPLPNGCLNQPYDEDVSFLFPNDTTLNVPPFGNITIPFDSFVVTSVTNIPTGMNYACNVASCTYITNPPNQTRGCVKVSGTPTVTTSPTDSIEVVGTAWVTILGSPTSFSDTIRIGLLIQDCGAAIDQSLAAKMNFTVSPNPVASGSKVSFTLGTSAQVELYMTDVFGRRIYTFSNSYRMPGQVVMEMDGMPSVAPGVYFINMNLDGVPSVSEKIVSVY